MRTLICLIAIFLSVSSSAREVSAREVSAREVSGVQVPEQLEAYGKTLSLNGVGKRTYFFATVYVAGLYLVHSSKDENAILELKEPAAVRMEFKHDVSEDDMRKAWRHFLEANAPGNWNDIKSRAESYLKAVPGVKKGDVLTHQFSPSGFKIFVGTKETASFEDPQLGRLVLATWIGAQPTTSEMKRDLLGK